MCRFYSDLLSYQDKSRISFTVKYNRPVMDSSRIIISERAVAEVHGKKQKKRNHLKKQKISVYKQKGYLKITTLFRCRLTTKLILKVNSTLLFVFQEHCLILVELFVPIFLIFFKSLQSLSHS